nr:major myo-inositol transporter IolT [Raoultella sp. NCTC 9187]
MTFVGIWMLGKIGRRTMTMIGQFGCTACLVFIGAVSYLLPETVNGQPDAAAGLYGAGGHAAVPQLPAGRAGRR